MIWNEDFLRQVLSGNAHLAKAGGRVINIESPPIQQVVLFVYHRQSDITLLYLILKDAFAFGEIIHKSRF